MQPKTKNIQNVSEQTATKYPNQTMKPCGEPKSEISYMEWFLQPLAFEIYNLSHCFTVLEKQMLKKKYAFPHLPGTIPQGMCRNEGPSFHEKK